MVPRKLRTQAFEPSTPTSTINNTPLRPSGTTTGALPTNTSTLNATATPLSFLRSIASVDTIPHHLVFTTLALLLASGLIVRRLHNRNRYRTPPITQKGIKKRKQDVVKSILIAQGQEEGSNLSKSRAQSGSTTPTTSSSFSFALLPSSSCIVSTSAAIWNNLEKIGAALTSNSSRSTTRHNVKKVESSTQTTISESSGRTGKETSNGKEGGTNAKKGKNKKGKGVVAGSTTPVVGKGSSSDMSRTSSKQGAEEGAGGGEIVKIDQGVQVTQLEVEPDPLATDDTTPTSTSSFSIAKTGSDETTTPSSSKPLLPTKATVSVQTSPRLLPYRPRTHSPSSSPSPALSNPTSAISSPAPTRPIAVPLSFDLHASFQSTPSSAPIPPTLQDDSPSGSPSLSSTPSRSPSISPSVSSGSPTGRRLSSASTPLLSGNASKSRKQAKKAAPTGINGKAVVGLPKPAEKLDDDETGGTERAETTTKTRANGKERPPPIPIPSNSSRPSHANDSTPQPQRRLSAASSKADSMSNSSFTSSGSPYSADRIALPPMMPPSMTMTPPDFARKSSTSTIYDRDETLRWSSNTSSRGGETSLRGLGVELERAGESEDGSVEGGDSRSRRGEGGGSVRGTSPKPPLQGYFPSIGRHSSYATPESSPHPAPRSLTPFEGPSHQPWISHPASSSSTSASTGANANLIPYPIASSSSSNSVVGPNASRPPSRQSSLSVPLNVSQQQQLHLQQQQQAYAIAQVQAQAAAQYQHVVALQYQAQLQIQQQQQRQKPGDTLENSSQVPNGLVYPFSSSTSSSSNSQVSNWPPNNGHSHSASSLPPNSGYPPPHISQSVSPTSMTFPSTANTMSPHSHSQAQMYQSYINQSAAYYLAATSSSSPHSSPSHHHQPQQQIPSRPRINSSVSAVAVLGGGGSSNNRNGSVSSPVSASSLASPRLIGTEKQRQSSTNPFSPLGVGAGGSNDPASAWKARAKEAEMEAGRTAKELEIARWRLSVLEGEQQANEVENQEALRALATRAMRAEARIKLLEETRKSDLAQSSPPTTAVDSSLSPSPAAASPAVPKPLDLPWNSSVSIDSQNTVNSGSGAGLHPLSWLDLDSVSFSTRPLNSSSSSRPPLSTSNSSTSNNRKQRSGRNSNGISNGNGRRQSGGHSGRRKSNNQSNPLSPSLHLSVPSTSNDPISPTTNGRHVAEEEEEDEDEEEIVFVLRASSRKPHRSPSRRSSYAASTFGGDESSLSITAGGGNGGEDASSFIDEDDIPTIEFDSDPPTNSRIQLVHPLHHQGGGNSSDSQNGSFIAGAEEEEEDQDVDYVGFLPGFLAKIRANGPTEGSEHSSPVLPSHSTSSEVTTPNAGEKGGGDSSNAYPYDQSSIPFSSTPPESPSSLVLSPVQDSTMTGSPPPLYHPFPIRPSQIALPPSPTLVSSPSPPRRSSSSP
ncbi:uncharacterized protein JCM6883_004686 [Sporobolomyces salmoneus]|uniref:uncharacterized protein n=1 Tax=Sporobolomyces salmoneus TaxID=183962 RepID=UPI0031723797